MTVPAVYTAIHAISAHMAREGIAKTQKNLQQNYKFRGIDQVMNALAPLLVQHHLLIIPRYLSRSRGERETKGGGTLFFTTLRAEFDFVSVLDGSKHTAAAYGEGMDSADKSANKAMAAAYKYAAFQTFCIPTEGDGDLDADYCTPRQGGDVMPEKPAPTPSKLIADQARATSDAMARELSLANSIPEVEPMQPKVSIENRPGLPSHVIAPAKPKETDPRALALKRQEADRKRLEDFTAESARMSAEWIKTLGERLEQAQTAANQAEVQEIRARHEAWFQMAIAASKNLTSADAASVRVSRLELEKFLRDQAIDELAKRVTEAA